MMSTPLKQAVDEWRGGLGISQDQLAIAMGKDKSSLSNALKKPPANNSNWIKKLATVISSITEKADRGRYQEFDIPVLGREDDEVATISTIYTGPAIPVADVIDSLQGKITVADLLSGRTDPPLVRDSFDWSIVLSLSRRQWLKDISAPSSLLTSQYAVVPFHGREQELADLESWALDETVLGVRLYTGAGGMGKTRLAMEACLRLAEKDFVCGFVEYDQADILIDHLRADYGKDDEKLLLVLDYAETHGETITRILKAAESQQQGRYRILLLSRAAGEWWEILRSSDHVVTDLLMRLCPEPERLGALALTTAQRKNSFFLALENFSAKLQVELPSFPIPDFSADYFERVLLLHMMALIVIEQPQAIEEKFRRGSRGGDSDPKGDEIKNASMMNLIFDCVLLREKKFWRDHIDARKLPTVFYQGFDFLAGVISGIGGVSHKEECIVLIRKIPLFHDQPYATIGAISDLLHEIYPGKMWIEPIAPDLLAERALVKAMKEDKVAFLAHFFETDSG